MNNQSKLFLGVFLLLFVFGMIFLSTLFLFGKSEYLTLGIITQHPIRLKSLFLFGIIAEDRQSLTPPQQAKFLFFNDNSKKMRSIVKL